MPDQAFGGDDDSGSAPAPAPERKKPKLEKYGLVPDTNIRDVFWKIMADYAATKKAGVDLKALENDRFALMRTALSIVTRPGGYYFGLNERFVVQYSLMLFLDSNWRDVFMEFLEQGKDGRSTAAKHLQQGIKKLCTTEAYRERLKEYFSFMLRNRSSDAVALIYLAALKNPELSMHVKKELIILARGGIGTDQLNAIGALSIIKDDEVKKSLIILLSHWDNMARMAAATALKNWKGDEELITALKRRLEIETDEEVIKTLKRLLK